MVLGYFEILFGRTLKRSVAGDYTVELTNNKIIRDRFVKSERLTLLVNPMFHDFQYKPIIEMIEVCEEYLAVEEVVDKNDKVCWLAGLREIIDDFKSKEDPKKEATEDLIKLVQSQVPQSPYVGLLIRGGFSQAINMQHTYKYIVKTTCYSGCMTNDDCIAYWLSEESISKTEWGEKVTNNVKTVIVRFLAKDFNFKTIS